MKLRNDLWALLIAGTVLVSPFAVGESHAAPRVVAPFYYQAPSGPYGYGGMNPYLYGGGVGMSPYGSTWGIPGAYGGGYPLYYGGPQIYSYEMPLPAYGILPPPFVTAHSYLGNNTTRGRTAEDYGYTRDSFEPSPRQRSTLYPAIPNESAVTADRLSEGRRVRFEIQVPSADAIVLIDGAKTRQSGLTREYVTPALDSDRLYTSTMEVQWTDEGGVPRTRRHTFEFIAGQSLRYQFIE